MSLQQNKYQLILNGLKDKIRQARFKAALTANAQLLAIYWEVGQTIIQQENEEGWGAKTVERLSVDLRTEFEDMKGLSVRNLRYMREFAKAYPRFSILQQPAAKSRQQPKVLKNKTAKLIVLKNDDPAILQQAAAKLPWGHHQVILDKVKNEEEKYFYIQKCIKNSWSRAVLSLQIDNKLFERQGKAINNFENTLPAIDSDLVKETFKSSYVFDFLTLNEEAKEKDLERALMQHLKKFMLELGRGFAYVGNQFNLVVEDDDYFLDLLFYNINLKCYVVFELKVGDFKPEFTGKLNFYTNTVNEDIKNKDDKPTIGILLCKTPNKTVVKYSLQGIKSPIGVSDYQFATALPKQLKGEMPTIEELEKEIEVEYTELLKPVDKKIGQLKELIKGLKQPPVKEKRTAANCERILTKVVLFLRNSITKQLEEKGMAERFEEIEIMVYTDNQGHRTDKAVKDYLKQRKEVGEFRIELRLNGFIPAGTKAFNIWKDLSIVTNTYNYTIGFERHSQNALLEKLYHQLPNKKEFENIIDKWMEGIVDSITQQLELIKQRRK
jgi:predicted nuclease of restriction endonuclease-like (RecB) superfamily